MSAFVRPFSLIGTALSLLVLQCGSFDDSSLAGGSGAGNPGGTVSISVTIITDSVLLKSTSVTKGLLDTNSFKHLQVKDNAGLPITITGVNVQIGELRLVLEESEDAGHVLNSSRDRSPYLSTDRHDMVINRNYSFNCFRDTADSSRMPIIMPIARYIGVRFQFFEETATRSGRGKILIKGLFVYGGQQHGITISVSRTFSPFYKFAGGIFTLSSTDTTNLQIAFNATRWLSGIDLKEYIEQRKLRFNAQGDLVIENSYEHNTMNDIATRIRNNFINSGRLVVY